MKGKPTQLYIQHTGVRKKVSQEVNGSWFTNEAGGTVLGATISIEEGTDVGAEYRAWKEYLRILVDEIQESELEAISAMKTQEKPVSVAQELSEPEGEEPSFGPPEEKTANMAVGRISFEQRKDKKYELGLFDKNEPNHQYPHLKYIADRDRMWKMVGHIETVDWSDMPFEKSVEDLEITAVWKFGRQTSGGGRYKYLLKLHG